MTEPVNSLNIEHLARGLVARMVESDPAPLDAVPHFNGAGLYAIYYAGTHAAYTELSAKNVDGAWQEPIYVGSTLPIGGRPRIELAADHGNTRALISRLRQHAASVRAATNLEVSDFAVRWLVMESIWIALGESAMIRRHQPVWNAVVDGFGNNSSDQRHTLGLRSRWDTIHPGRSVAGEFAARSETAGDIAQDVREYLRQRLTL